MTSVRSMRWAAAGIALGLMLAACESAKSAGGGSASHEPPTSPAPPAATDGSTGGRPFGFASSGDTNFDTWRLAFAAKADGSGRNDAVIRSVLDGLVPVEQKVVTQSFDNQAEFVKPIWDYAKSAVSATRIANGQTKLSENKTIFDQLEESYAPPREIVAAIWGMETSYGSFIGVVDAPRVLATQAAMGRR